MENQEETKPTPAKSKSASQKAPKLKIDTSAKTQVEAASSPKTPAAATPAPIVEPAPVVLKPTPSLTDQEKMLVTENLEPEPEKPREKPQSFKLMPESVVKRETQKTGHTKEIILSGIILLALVFGGYQAYLWHLNKQTKVIIKPDHASLNKMPSLQDTALASSTSPTTIASGTSTSTLPAMVKTASSTQTTSTTPIAMVNKLKITSTPTGYLNVRSQPASSASLVTQVHPGETYTYTNKKSGWYQIALNDGTSGWVSGQYVSVQ